MSHAIVYTPPPISRVRTSAVALVVTVILIAASAMVFVNRPNSPVISDAGGSSVRILGAKAATLDPAAQSDAGSAQVVSQLFESLTAIDAAGKVQPALATGWTQSADGLHFEFQLRTGLEFSDGSALTASDVVNSWLRVLDPAHPSQLASLLDDVKGAAEYAAGHGSKSAVGLSAPAKDRFDVDLVSPESDLPAIASSPTLAIVPAKIDTAPAILTPSGFVGSGAYTLSALTDTETTLQGNPHYWAGMPAISTVHLLSSIGGKSPVSEFQAGNLDYTPISLYDASWITYDRSLGPSLRIEPSPSIEYYGFNTTKPPFDNVHVRRAFAMGIDWRRLVQLLGDPLEVPATGMVPPGVPNHSSSDYGPVFNLIQARSELALAGYANGQGFPSVTLVTTGGQLDEAIVKQAHDNLGVTLQYQAMDWTTYNARLLSDPPAFWQMGWVADYPGANDFLGLLLGTGKTNNFGRWSSTEFDTAVNQALSAKDPADMQKAWDQVQSIVADQAPVIPVDYGAGYSLSNPKLLGALPNGQGLVRYAGLAWGK